MTATLDLAPLLMPISDSMPAGENLEYDPAMIELERAATPKPERRIGESVIAGEDPDWRLVVELSKKFLGRSKDLRAAVYLTTAELRLEGLPGWANGLALIRGLLENYWDTVYPQLDAEDNNDPTARVNCVSALADPLAILGYFRTAIFVRSPRLGQFSLRSLRIANGTIKVNDGETPKLAEIEACCLDCPESDLFDVLQAIRTALEHATAIDRIFVDKVGVAGPEFKILLSDHRELLKFLESQAEKRSPHINADSVEENDTQQELADASKGGVSRGAGSGGINGPQDVKAALDLICAYYARMEPSSPVPLLLRRAQRLVGANFLDLMTDLAPSGISEIRAISGSSENK